MRRLDALVDVPKLPEIVITEEMRRDVALTLNAYQTLNGTMFAYVSMPVTSGPRLYDIMESRGFTNVAELKAKDPESFVRDVIGMNVNAGQRLARRIQGVNPRPVIVPGLLNAKGKHWGEQEYMSLWLSLLNDHVKDVYMVDGWQYSNGCAQEYAQSVHQQFFKRKGMRTHIERSFAGPGESIAFHKRRYIEECKKRLPIVVFTQSGKLLPIDKGFLQLADAIEDIADRGFDANGLKDSFRLLYDIGRYFVLHPSRGTPPYRFDWESMDKTFGKIGGKSS